jgi:hypothetical protein
VSERQRWHYRRKVRIRASIWRLKFELPETPGLEDLAAIVHELVQLDADMAAERPISRLMSQPRTNNQADAEKSRN